MTNLKKLKMRSIMILLLGISFTACVTDDYDLKKGLSTDIAVGGDSLTLALAETDSITLGKLLGGQDISILTKATDGSYALNLKDSIQKVLPTIQPVSFSIGAINTPLIKTNSIDVNFPQFQLPVTNISSPLSIPIIDVSPIGSNINDTLTFTTGISGIPTGLPSGQKIDNIPPIIIANSRKIPEKLNFTNTNTALNKINSVSFKDNIVKLILRKKLPPKISETKSIIDTFRVDFPTQFTLSKINNNDPGEIKNNSSFVISNYELKGLGDFTVSFRINNMDLSAVDQNPMTYSDTINYKIKYQLEFTVMSDDANYLNGQKIGIFCGIDAAAPVIDDAQILTNSFAINLTTPSDSKSVNTDVPNIPVDISQVNFLTFSGNPNLKLTIDNPLKDNNGNDLFQFNAGTCTITLPNSFDYTNGSKTLSIPATNLLGSNNTVGISGITLNKPVVPDPVTNKNKITISDQLKYDISGLTVNPTTISLNQMKSLNGKSLNIKAECSPFLIDNANVNTNSITFPIPDQTTNINISKLVSTDVKRISTVSLKTPSTVVFKISVSNLPSKFSTINFKNYTIKLPSCLKFATSDNLTNNELVLNDGFNVNTGFSKELHLEGFNWVSNGISLSADGTFSLNEAITMTGSVYVNSTVSLDSKNISATQINVQPLITIADMALWVIKGEIKPPIDPISQSVKLDLPASLKNANNNLDIKNPVIEFKFGNSMGIAIDLAVNLVPKSKGIAIPGASVSTNLHISETSTPGQTTWSKYRLSAVATGIADDYKMTLLPELANLLKTIPDSISINATAVISGNSQTVDLYSPKNQIDINYKVNVPLDFGSGFKLQLNDTIANLKNSLKDLLKMTRNIDIIAQVENKIPMDFAFKVSPCNTAGQVISGITVSSDSIRYNNLDPISFGLRETTKGALDELDKLILSISATKNYATSLIPLNANQFMKLKLKVRVPKGINITAPSQVKAKK